MVIDELAGIGKQEVLRRLHTDSRQGISEEQARQRLKANGENRLSDRKKQVCSDGFCGSFRILWC